MVSIIIPVYNGEACISDCLESILCQKNVVFEVLVIDNKSTDNTASIIKEYSKTDPRIKYLFCEESGVSCARNLGITSARYDFIFFIDGDDLFFPDTLPVLLNNALEYKSDITFSSIELFKNNKSVVYLGGRKSVYAEKKDIPAFFSDELPSYVCFNVFKLYKKSFILNNNIAFDLNMSLGEDLIFSLKCFSLAKKIFYNSRPLYKYRLTNQGLNMKYRPNMIEIKLYLQNEIKKYLIENNVFNDNYYMILINEIYKMLLNEKKTENGNLEKVLNLDCIKELTNSRIFRRLPIKKKILFVILKYKFHSVLQLVLSWRVKHEHLKA